MSLQPSPTALHVWQERSSAEDFLHVKDSAGNVVFWIDSSGGGGSAGFISSAGTQGQRTRYILIPQDVISGATVQVYLPYSFPDLAYTCVASVRNLYSANPSFGAWPYSVAPINGGQIAVQLSFDNPTAGDIIEIQTIVVHD